jgi:Ca2+-binding EF-hand superfamily protein
MFCRRRRPHINFFTKKVIAHKSSAEDILDLRKLFDQYDVGNDGTISFDEFRKGLEASNIPEKEIKEIFKSIVSTVCRYSLP